MRVRSRIAGTLVAVAITMVASLASGGTAHAANASAGPALQASVFNPIRHVATNLCLQPESPADFARVLLKKCVADPSDTIGIFAQSWQFQQVATNHYKFINQLSGKCLDAAGPAADWTPIVIHDCTNISNEEFNTGATLPDIVTLESRIGFRDSRFCVEPPGNSSDGSAVFLFGCIRSIGQRWVVGFPL